VPAEDNGDVGEGTYVGFTSSGEEEVRRGQGRFRMCQRGDVLRKQ